MSKKTRTEAGLEAFAEKLREYEAFLQLKSQAEIALAKTISDLERTRAELMHYASGIAPVQKEKAKPRAKGKAKAKSDWRSRLAEQDPRVQRTLGEILKLIETNKGPMHKGAVADKLRVSGKAIDLRIRRGLSLGFLRRENPGWYDIKK